MSRAYADPAYASSLAFHGGVLALPRSGGHLLVRAIPGSGLSDARGPYPFFMCERWSELGADLDALGEGLVSAVLVADPLGGWASPDELGGAFPDVLRPFKPHYVVDLDGPWERELAGHHRRNAARGLERVEVDVTEDALPHLDTWVSLYDRLIERHRIRGVARFSREAFALQLGVPGVVLVRALVDGRTVGAAVWYRAGERAYYHLAAYTGEGYEANASHALFLSALRWLEAAGVRRVNLGGGAGLAEDPDDGLVRFKRGWATSSRSSWLCGRVIDRPRYDELCHARGGRAPMHDRGSGFFPAYRSPSPDEPEPEAEEGDRGAA